MHATQVHMHALHSILHSVTQQKNAYAYKTAEEKKIAHFSRGMLGIH